MVIIIGVDPDSERHGIALFKNKKLVSLQQWALPQVIDFIATQQASLLFSIEDVMRNGFVYKRNVKKYKPVQDKITMDIGRCQQSQVELMRVLDHYGIKYVLHKPHAGNWANNKKMFELVTKWNKRSNVDTRSAAYFGFLEASK